MSTYQSARRLKGEVLQEPMTMSLEDAARAVGYSTKTLRRAISAQKLVAAQASDAPHSAYRISRVELARWWRARGGGQLFPDLPVEEIPEAAEAEAGQQNEAEGEPPSGTR